MFLSVLLLENNEFHMGYIFKIPNKQPIVQYITMQNKKGCIFLKFSDTDIIPYLPEYSFQLFDKNDLSDPAVLKNDIENYWSRNKYVDRIYVISEQRINRKSKRVKVDTKCALYKNKQYVTVFDRDNSSK